MNYRIRITGEVGPSTLAALGEPSATIGGGESVLEVQISDQPELFGLLSRIQALGLGLVEVSPSRSADESDREDERRVQ